jgi:DNA modification methylase
MTPYYEHAGITIYCGDCREVLGGGSIKAALLCTDPPYGIGAARHKFGGHGVKQHHTGLAAGKMIAKRDYGDGGWDDAPPDAELIDLIRSCAPYQIIFGGNYFQLPPSKCWLVWDKLRGNTDFADCELAWTNLNKAVRRIAYRWNGFLVQPGCKDVRTHPTQKPQDVMRWAILQAPDTCKSVIDPFMGSGTTLEAAKALGLSAIGIEREERYCEIAAQRLSQEMLITI